jgi:hypothetical protein
MLANDQAARHLQKVKMENKGHIYGEIALLLPGCKMQYEKKKRENCTSRSNKSSVD